MVQYPVYYLYASLCDSGWSHACLQSRVYIVWLIQHIYCAVITCNVDVLFACAHCMDDRYKTSVMYSALLALHGPHSTVVAVR